MIIHVTMRLFPQFFHFLAQNDQSGGVIGTKLPGKSFENLFEGNYPGTENQVVSVGDEPLFRRQGHIIRHRQGQPLPHHVLGGNTGADVSFGDQCDLGVPFPPQEFRSYEPVLGATLSLGELETAYIMEETPGLEQSELNILAAVGKTEGEVSHDQGMGEDKLKPAPIGSVVLEQSQGLGSVRYARASWDRVLAGHSNLDLGASPDRFLGVLYSKPEATIQSIFSSYLTTHLRLVCKAGAQYCRRRRHNRHRGPVLPGTRLPYRVVLFAILGLATWLRLRGIGFGLPCLEARPDETIAVFEALRFGTADLNPRDFHWPTLYPYLLFLLYGFHVLLGLGLGWYDGLLGVLERVQQDPALFVLTARVVSLTAGVGSVYALYGLGRRVLGTSGGLLAALFLSVCHLHVRQSQAGVPDSLMIFLAIVAVWQFLRLDAEPSKRNALLSGLLLGLATGTKYNAGLLFLPLVFIFLRRSRHKGERQAMLVNVSIAASTALLAFTLTTPYWLLDPETFFGDLGAELEHLGEGHQGLLLEPAWLYHVTTSLWYGCGWPLLLLGLLGLGPTFAPRTWPWLVVQVFPVGYYVFTASAKTVFTRHALPLVPFLLLAAAATTLGLFRRRPRSAAGSSLGPPLLGFLLLVILTPTLVSMFRAGTLLGREDNRVLVGRAVDRLLPASNHLGVGSSYYGKPLLSRRSLDLRTLVATPHPLPVLPDWALIERSPLRLYSTQPERLEEVLKRCYRLARDFPATVPAGDCSTVYDQQDAWYLPFSGYCPVSRPGPSFQLYRLLPSCHREGPNLDSPRAPE